MDACVRYGIIGDQLEEVKKRVLNLLLPRKIKFLGVFLSLNNEKKKTSGSPNQGVHQLILKLFFLTQIINYL